MKTMTTALVLTALLLSVGMNSLMLHADELLTRQQTLSPCNIASLTGGEGLTNLISKEK